MTDEQKPHRAGREGMSETPQERGIPCARCGGTGAYEDVGGVDRSCSDCLGTGEVPDDFYDGDTNDNDRRDSGAEPQT